MGKISPLQKWRNPPPPGRNFRAVGPRVLLSACPTFFGGIYQKFWKSGSPPPPRSENPGVTNNFTVNSLITVPALKKCGVLDGHALRIVDALKKPKARPSPPAILDLGQQILGIIARSG